MASASQTAAYEAARAGSWWTQILPVVLGLGGSMEELFGDRVTIKQSNSLGGGRRRRRGHVRAG